MIRWCYLFHIYHKSQLSEIAPGHLVTVSLSEI